MNEYLRTSIMNRLNTTAVALRRNRMEACVVESRDELLAQLRELLPKGAVICSGGSMTLEQSGVIDLLSGSDYDFYFRGRTDENGALIDVYNKAFSADWYFSSSNAITLSGELYNMDGNANRVAALCYGPQNVVIVAGYNKVVADLREAEERVRAIAAPANCVRLNKSTGCSKTGHCADCRTPDRICCTATIHSFQRTSGRIKVFLVMEELGY